MLGVGVSVMAMIQSLRSNKSLLERTKKLGGQPVLKRVASAEERERRRINQPVASPELLASIRAQNVADRGRTKVLSALVFVGSAVVVAGLFYMISVITNELNFKSGEVQISQAEQIVINRKRNEALRLELAQELPRAESMMRRGDYFGAMGLYKHLWRLRMDNEDLANQYVLSTVYFVKGQKTVNQKLLLTAWEEYVSAFPNGSMRVELEEMVLSSK